MTKTAERPPETGSGAPLACVWCRRPVAPTIGPGRPRKYCKRSCRQRDFEARQRALVHGLDESALIVARSELDALRDELYVLACAVQDVDRDIAAAATVDEYRDALRWLLDAARPLVDDDGRFTPSRVQ